VTYIQDFDDKMLTRIFTQKTDNVTNLLLSASSTLFLSLIFNMNINTTYSSETLGCPNFKVLQPRKPHTSS
jgi:hypothetical protein